MVFHDYDLHRLTGHGGRIRAHSARDLGAIRSWTRKTAFRRWRRFWKSSRAGVPLLIEVKDQDGDMGPGAWPLEHAIAQVLAGYAGDVALMSFNPHSVAALAALGPRWALRAGSPQAPMARTGRFLSRAARDRLRGIPIMTGSARPSSLARGGRPAAPRVAELKVAGAAILCWTVRSLRDRGEGTQMPTTSPSKATTRPSRLDGGGHRSILGRKGDGLQARRNRSRTEVSLPTGFPPSRLRTGDSVPSPWRRRQVASVDLSPPTAFSWRWNVPVRSGRAPAGIRARWSRAPRGG